MKEEKKKKISNKGKTSQCLCMACLSAYLPLAVNQQSNLIIVSEINENLKSSTHI